MTYNVKKRPRGANAFQSEVQIEKKFFIHIWENGNNKILLH